MCVAARHHPSGVVFIAFEAHCAKAAMGLGQIAVGQQQSVQATSYNLQGVVVSCEELHVVMMLTKLGLMDGQNMASMPLVRLK